MKIGITSSFNINLYASILISLLISKFEKPSCIILSNQPKFFKLKETARFFSQFFERMKPHYHTTSEFSDQREPYSSILHEYISRKNIEDCKKPLSVLGKKHEIEFVVTNSINSKEIVEFIKKREIDVLVNVGGGIFRSAIISATKIGILNAHMGYLPNYRGMNALEWALFYGHQPGVTLHFIDRGIDTGDILLFREVTIQEDDCINTLREKSLIVSIEMILEGLDLINNKKEIRKKQNLNQGKQYFVMHERLCRIVERKIKRQYL